MNYRDLFEGIEDKIQLKDGRYITPINFDNGATTPPLKSVIKIIEDNIKNYGPIARGVGFKGDYCTKIFNNTRETILKFFNLQDTNTHTIIYTKSDTESLNILANELIQDKNDIILSTRMEHHANDLPFRKVGKVVYAEVDELGRVKVDDIENQLIKANGKIKIVTITGASNVTGYINHIHEVAKIAHKYGALIIVDAAQLIAHKSVDMKGASSDELIDFLTFSAHKAYAPFGSGAIVGLKEYLKDSDPILVGGGCVNGVFDKSVVWSPIPSRYEAGTQNFFGVISMAKALEDLKNIGLDKIQLHEKYIKEYLINGLNKIPNIIIYGDTNYIDDRLGVITFNIKDKCCYDIGPIIADETGISLRVGKFCAHPYVHRLLGVSDADAYSDVFEGEDSLGMIRVSLGLYNTINEANVLLNKLEDISKRLN